MALPEEILAESTTLFHDVLAEDVDPELHAAFVIARVLDHSRPRRAEARPTLAPREEGAGHGFMRGGEDPEGSEADRKTRTAAWERWKTLLKEL